jgi:hypothetical protein
VFLPNAQHFLALLAYFHQSNLAPLRPVVPEAIET